MGGSRSKPDQSSKQSQSNSNRIIDQSTGAAWLQLNWASFGGGVSSILIIIFLVILLYFCWRQNRRANAKARKAELHELLAIAGRRGSFRHHSSREPKDSRDPPPYPGTSSGYPGSSSGGFPGSPPGSCNPGTQFHGAGLPPVSYTHLTLPDE